MPAAKASPAPLAPTMALAGSATEPSARRDPSRPPTTAPSRKVSRRPAHGAEREHILDRPRDCGRVSRAVGAPRLASGQRADLVIVDDEPIEMRQAGAAELGEPLGAGRHQFEIGGEAGGARLAQHRDPAIGARPATAGPSPCARPAIQDAEFSLASKRNRSRRASSRPPRPDDRNGCAGRWLRR